MIHVENGRSINSVEGEVEMEWICDDRRRWKENKVLRGFWAKTRHEYSHQMERGEKRGIKMWKRAVRWKWYGHAGWSCSPDSSLFLCLFTSPPLSLLGRLTLPFIHLTAHRRRDEWQRGEGWKSRMKGEGRMSSRRTSKCSPADLLEELEKKSLCMKIMDRDGISATISNICVN